MHNKFKRLTKDSELRVLLTSLLVCLLIILSFGITNAQKFNYPPAQIDKVADDYFGTKVSDPYRWLEDPDFPETQAWVEAENKLTYDFINSTPERERIEARITKLWNYSKYSVPKKAGDRYYYTKNDGLQNQSVLYMKKSLEGAPVEILDPNKFSPDGTVALSDQVYSRDGRFLAYAISTSGSDWQEVKILDIDQMREYPETIKWCRYSDIAWKEDNSGFFYNRYPEPNTVAQEDQFNYNRVYWHKLGTPQTEDQLVYEQPEARELGFSPLVTQDGDYLILSVWHGTDEKNRIYYREVESNRPFIRLLNQADARYSFIENLDSLFYFVTDLNSPKGRVIAIDVKNPEKEDWKEIIPETEGVITSAKMVNHQLVVVYMQDVHDRMKIYTLEGKPLKEIELQDLGSVDNLSARKKDKEMFFGFTSFLYPSTIFRYDFITEKLSIFHQAKVDFNPSQYETKQIFYTSRDGTKVPMFIVHKKGLKLDGGNPTILYGYGGFNIALTPYFSTSRLIFLENGGVFTVANLRGGSEYGEDWHQAGMLNKKQNVFDDFISAAEWLIENKYTNSKKLAIIGGSNGGLLVAACMVQRPELFGAVICENALTDMLRYHKFTVGKYWVGEYGNAEVNPEHFKFLYAYSPYHNVQEGVSYPPTLITTADTDDRVVPAHAKKFAATLQSASAGENPLLLRVETKAGHGAGKPTSKIIEEISDIYAFLFKILGMKISD